MRLMTLINVIAFCVLTFITTVLANTPICTSQDPKKPFETCHMIDYPIYLPNKSMNLHLVDWKAEIAFESFTEEAFTAEDGWSLSKDCANAMRSFQCVLAFPGCEPSVRPLYPCEATCNQFADICFSSQRAANFKKSTCQYWEKDDCVRVPMPGDAPGHYGYSRVLANETKDVFGLGKVTFGAKELYIQQIGFRLDITGIGNNISVKLQSTKPFIGQVGYWFKIHGFPYIETSGIVEVTLKSIDMDFSYAFDRRRKEWSGEVIASSVKPRVAFFETGIKYLADFVRYWWSGWIDGVIEFALKKVLQDVVTDAIPYQVGILVTDNPNVETDLGLDFAFKNLYSDQIA